MRICLVSLDYKPYRSSGLTIYAEDLATGLTEQGHAVTVIADWERPLYYSMADLYVSPSFLEGLGATPIEALACETPAIVTAATSGPEEIGCAGLVVPPFDSQALAEAIQSLLADPEQRQQMGKWGREYVLAEFSYQRMAQLTLESYAKAHLT